MANKGVSFRCLAMALASAVAMMIASGGAVGGEKGAPLTCNAFVAALWKAITAGGSQIALPALAQPFEKGAAPTSVGFKNIVGVEGVMRCAADGRFENLRAVVEVVPHEPDLRIRRLRALAGAAVCAVTPTLGPAQCDSVARHYSETAIMAFVRAYDRGERDPDGRSVVQVLRGGYELQFRAMPGLVSFSLSTVGR